LQIDMRNSLTSLLVLASLTVGAGANPKPRAIDKFASNLHAEVGKTKGNLIYSPASVAVALAMTREGATGETAKQMDAVLGKDAGVDAKAIRLAFKSSPTADKDAPKAPELAIANRLFGDAKSTWEKKFLAVTGNDYGAPIESVDFRGKPDAARLKINKWVEDQTKGRIKDLLEKGVIEPLTRLVLVNAIYLKAQWVSQFMPHLTKPKDFAIAGGTTKQVPTMHGVVHAGLGKYAGGRIIDLPYHSAPNGPQLAMMVVVPDTGKLEAIEAAYAKEGLLPFMKAIATHGEADVAMPKFKVGSQFSLNEVLGKMGMPRAFDSTRAEFDGMTKDERLHIAHVIHKAWIEVDEKGTEAAAATAVVMNSESARPKPVPFKIDRSFAFFIHDERGTVLFGGRVIDPTAKD
jgi:serpin B